MNMLIHNKHQQPITSSNSPVMLLSGEYLWAVLGSQTCKDTSGMFNVPCSGERQKRPAHWPATFGKKMSCFKAL